MASSHHNWGLLFYKMGPYCRFYNLLGYTELLDNPDSWEGWHWGAVHAWGYSAGHCEILISGGRLKIPNR
jgi:trimethylamine-N-oxide reductase (cytochrome c)